MTDPIADMLTRIRNASRVRKGDVYIPFSKLKLAIIKILKEEGFIAGYEEQKTGKFGGIVVQLKYEDKQPTITTLKRISKPGRRVYVAHEDLPRVLNNIGIAIVSNSQGIMTNKAARKLGLGGEILCEIY
ncbi:MAG: 30S ribosomal protein S8 [Candidatus Buchananbacteria bacterium]|nr:30S ribosomal protein S8 [Candidatus Buchananbacteria bacterium]